MESAFEFVDGSVFFVYKILHAVDEVLFHFSNEKIRFGRFLFRFGKIK